MDKKPGTRLAVDIGGTFTDVALEYDDKQFTTKTLTTKSQPEIGVLAGIETVLTQAKINPSQVETIIYGTTLATNLLIERRGASVALVTTLGFRDVVEMRNENRFEQYDINIELPVPLVPRSQRLAVSERVAADGRILKSLDEDEVRALIPNLLEKEIQSVAIGFLHSYKNNSHEQRVREIICAEAPELDVTLSSEVSPEMREFERISTACANAYVQPLMSRHLRSLAYQLRTQGLDCPLFLMLSGGGITTLETAIRFPVRLVESGPAGGAIFSSFIANQLGLPRVLSYDMGGTTAKVCLIDDGQPHTSRTFEVAREYRFLKGSGIPINIPVIEMVEIGAGGGSIADVDSMNRIRVGPESADSEPGPASYDLGGTAPTVTDADLLLGRLNPENFAGGNIRLNVENATKALDGAIGRKLDFKTSHTALGVSEIVDENMSNAARVHAIESGVDIETYTVVAFGGAAPIHVARLAEKLNIQKIVIPPGAGVGSALGFLQAPVSYEVIRSYYQKLGDLDYQGINQLLHSMRKEATDVVEPGAQGQKTREIRIAFMRYIGQGHEVSVEIPVKLEESELDSQSSGRLTTAFETEYTRLYGRTIPSLEIEILTWSLLVSTKKSGNGLAMKTSAKSYAPDSTEFRKLMDAESGEFNDASVYDRLSLAPGARIDGPAIVTESDTATVITRRFKGQVIDGGYMIFERKNSR
jgi:N-methylhydantoinase A